MGPQEIIWSKGCVYTLSNTPRPSQEKKVEVLVEHLPLRAPTGPTPWGGLGWLQVEGHRTGQSTKHLFSPFHNTASQTQSYKISLKGNGGCSFSGLVSTSQYEGGYKVFCCFFFPSHLKWSNHTSKNSKISSSGILPNLLWRGLAKISSGKLILEEKNMSRAALKSSWA